MPRFHVRAVFTIALVLTLSATMCASSKYPGYPFPFVSSVTPQAVVPGSVGFTLNIYGANFNSSSIVNWNRQPRQTTFISARQLQAQILATDIAQATAGYITVTNTTPGGTLSTFASPSALVEVHTPTATISPGTPAFYSYDFPIVAADTEGDSELDLVASTFSAGREEMISLMNAGDRSFVTGPVATYDYYGYGDVEFGDVNGDGKLDIVFAQGNYKYSNTSLQANLGNGEGTFTPSTPFGYWENDSPEQFVLGDFNRDGTLDVAVASRVDETTRWGTTFMPVFAGNGDGTFVLSSSATVPGGPIAVVAGDFNGDGILDLVTVSQESASTITQSIGNADGTFQKHGSCCSQVVGSASPKMRCRLRTSTMTATWTWQSAAKQALASCSATAMAHFNLRCFTKSDMRATSHLLLVISIPTEPRI